MKSKERAKNTVNLNRLDAHFIRALTICELIDARADVLAFLYSAKPGEFYRAIPCSMDEINRIADLARANKRLAKATGFYRKPRSKEYGPEEAYFVVDASGVKIDALKSTSRRFRRDNDCRTI